MPKSEPEPEPELLGVPHEDWKHDEGFEEAQQSLGSAHPTWHQFVTQSVAAGKPPGRLVRTSLQGVCSPSIAMVGLDVIAVVAEGVAGIAILGGNEAERRNEEDKVERTHGRSSVKYSLWND